MLYNQNMRMDINFKRGLIEPCTISFLLITLWMFQSVEVPEWKDFSISPARDFSASEKRPERIRPGPVLKLPPRYRITTPRFTDPVQQLVGPRVPKDAPQPDEQLHSESRKRNHPGDTQNVFPGVPVGDGTPAREVRTIQVRPTGLRMLLP